MPRNVRVRQIAIHIEDEVVDMIGIVIRVISAAAVDLSGLQTKKHMPSHCMQSSNATRDRLPAVHLHCAVMFVLRSFGQCGCHGMHWGRSYLTLEIERRQSSQCAQELQIKTVRNRVDLEMFKAAAVLKALQCHIRQQSASMEFTQG